MATLYVVPIANNLIGSNNITGNVSVNTTSAVVIGTGTDFTNEMVAGDYAYVLANSTAGGEISRVVTVTNSTQLTLSSNMSFANTTAKFRRTFPKGIPIFS